MSAFGEEESPGHEGLGTVNRARKASPEATESLPVESTPHSKIQEVFTESTLR